LCGVVGPIAYLLEKAGGASSDWCVCVCVCVFVCMCFCV